MQLGQIINLNTVHIDFHSQSKTAVFIKISQLLSQCHPLLDTGELFTSYWKRESLGSTAIGQGIAIPHIRSSKLIKPLGCVLKLLHPIDFGAEDKQPVDLIIALIVPQEQTEQHLKILGEIVKQFSAPLFRTSCRLSQDHGELYNLLVSG